MSTFFKELKRRKVFRVAGTYVLVSWLIIQFGSATFDALKLPSWALTLIIIILFTGFPIAIIFSWIFDRTPEGKIKIDERDKDLRPFAKKKRTWFALAGIVAGIVLGVFFARLYSPYTINENGINDKSIAVLPFTSFSDEKEDSYFADGMHDDILTQLSKIKDINVISRTSVVQYKNTTKTMGEIAKELNVVHILEGSVRRAGNQIRIVSQLINAVTDKHIWSETYDRDYADIFAIQSDVAKKIAAALKATLTPEEIEYIEEKPTDNMEAYDYFLKGKHFWYTYTTQEGNQRAVDLFDKATELDPNFALAYAWASITHSALYSNLSWDHTEERKELAMNAIDKALALDPDHPQIHFANGNYLLLCTDDYNTALKEYEIAYKGDPNNSDIVSHFAYAYWRLGFWEKAEKYLLKTYELDSLESVNVGYLGRFYEYLRQFQTAEDYYYLSIQLNPEKEWYYTHMAGNYIDGFGDIEKARSLLKKAELIVPNPQFLLGRQSSIERYARDFSKALSYAKERKKYSPGALTLAYAYYFMGEDKLAQEEFESLREYYEEKVEDQPENATFHSSLGIVYAHLGLKERAIEEGIKGVELQPVSKDHYYGPFRIGSLAVIYIITDEHELALENLEYLLSIPSYLSRWYLRLHPIYDPLRDNPRFMKLVDEG